MSKHAVSGEEVKLKNGESFDWICCDCGKAHHIHARYQGGRVVLRVFNDDFLTGRARKKLEVRKK